VLAVLGYVLLAVLPAALFRGVRGAVLRWAQGHPWRQPPPALAERTLEELVADLRRLEEAYRRTERATEMPYLAARLQAISLAYDDTLRICCRVLDVPEPGDRPPWTPVTRLGIEAELARAGLSW
jgi:hypothetical protein